MVWEWAHDGKEPGSVGQARSKESRGKLMEGRMELWWVCWKGIDDAAFGKAEWEGCDLVVNEGKEGFGAPTSQNLDCLGVTTVEVQGGCTDCSEGWLETRSGDRPSQFFWAHLLVLQGDFTQFLRWYSKTHQQQVSETPDTFKTAIQNYLKHQSRQQRTTIFEPLEWAITNL